tara:strand:+ start:19934 stop:21178 length:1245 start_codon:yes stop_codon:yes gene_type:complete
VTDLLKDCGAHLNARLDVIIEKWFEACKQDDALGIIVTKLSRKAFLDDIPDAIEGLAKTIACGDHAFFAPDAKVLDLHSQHRWKQGFSLRQLIRDWGNLNKILINELDAFFHEHHQADHAARALVFTRFADFIKNALSESVRCFEALRQREAGGVANELQAIHDQFEEATHSRSQLLREATHDLRGGLSAIAGATAVLKVSEQPNKMFGDALESLERGVASVKAMLDSLLDLSRLESGEDQAQLKSVDIAETLTRLAEEYRPVAHGKHLKLSTSGEHSLIVETDAEKIRRIVQNILINALTYTLEGEVNLAWYLEREQERWAIEISDSGPGIDCTHPTSLAHELETDKPIRKPAGAFSGEGIGLTIVKRLCEALGASIQVRSAPADGTRFTIHFPLSYDRPGLEASEQAPPAKP